MTSHWSERAACRNDAGRHVMDDAMDYPKSNWTIPAAKEFCNVCPVRNHCLTDNLHMRHGVVGGLDETERGRLRRRIRRAQLKKERATL